MTKQKTSIPSFPSFRYFIHTFGCQMNENDSERLAGILEGMGAVKAAVLEESTLILINTCAVRQKSEEKLYSLLGRLDRIKRKNGALIGVLGCVAQLYRDNLIEKKPTIDFVMGPDNYGDLPDTLAGISSHDPQSKRVITRFSREWHEIADSLILRESSFSAYVTIMEGCDNFCSYCVVPFTRGREKFRPIRNILAEIQSLAKNNYREVLLLGQNVNSYKDPESGIGFVDLLKTVNSVEEIDWIRFITSHPKNFSPEIAQTMAANRKICRQLHLPVQSGSSDILARMKRQYTRDEYLENIAFIKVLMPDIALSADIIVGYPGETEKDHKETLSLLEEVRYTNIFSFRYSPRPRSAAAGEEDSVPLEVKRQRLIEVQALQKDIQLSINRTFIGKNIKTLCTGKSKKDTGRYTGRSEGYQVINFDAGCDVVGQFVQVEITSCGPYSLRGRMVESKDACPH
ncbi:MAG: tRNA (N6-isopentenyl adenosine(37)-C2)-methylthiotransferase MiaB [Acidobacteria bacterium]|nr:tRNA (N6-isopentenyl adenosine(37)-C2)-methylthiotransferase MiaB [Acidobacteriota bacterium]MBU4253698.1 tRNA (N6-isopentenyl adenosine(37)-C2)-methylthiotransferase MiaB [Acidobacteriota bacterium]